VSQKNVYSVFRYNPPSVGFAQLSDAALALNGAEGMVPSPTIGSVVVIVSATTVSKLRTYNGATGFSTPDQGLVGMAVAGMIMLIVRNVF
jgi:hypothetical protein